MNQEKLLKTKYNDYNINNLENPYYQDVRLMSVEERHETAEKIRIGLLEKWEKNRQPLGGGKKSDEQIIKDFKSLIDLDINSILFNDANGNENVLKFFGKSPSGINQYFPEMLDTPISLGSKSVSVMDVIKSKEKFQKFFESIVYTDRMYSWTMWVGVHKETWGIKKIEDLIPDNVFKLLGDVIPYNYSNEEKKYIGFKLPFYYKDNNSNYYKLMLDGYKSYNEPIYYKPCEEKEYEQNMRIFSNITQSFRLGGGSQPVSNFSAGIARFLIENGYNEFFNIIEKDTFVILDTSTGWAGRLVGCLSCFTKIRQDYKEKTNKELTIVYLTTDPNSEINDRYNDIIDDWFTKIESKSDRRFFKFKKSLFGSETKEFLDFCKQELYDLGVNGCTIGLTSPPYFNRECYSKDDNQSCVLYGNNYESWSKGFLKPTIENISQLMLNGSTFYFNIADLSGGKKYTLEQDSIQYAKEIGLSVSNDNNDVYKMLMATMTGNNQNLDTGNKPKNSVNIGTLEKEKYQKYEPIFKMKKIISTTVDTKLDNSKTKNFDWFDELF